MKIPNYLMTSLAFVGAVSLIIMACSTDTASNSATGTTSLTGKYQISSCSYRDWYRYFDILDTQTGVVKHYSVQGYGFNLDTPEGYQLIGTYNTQP
jgi:hypothetical protein